MKKFGRGFTLVEVSLFLAVSGLLFLGVTVGVQNSMYQQRFNDSVQGFAEFLRGVYAEVENTQNLIGGGRSDLAIYGKLVTFGEEGQGDKIWSYNVIGDINDFNTGNALTTLAMKNANVIYKDGKEIKTAGIVDSYTPRWGAQIESTSAEDYGRYKGTLLIIRHPSSGTMYTYVMNGTVLEVAELIKEAVSSGRLRSPFEKNDGSTYLDDKDFKREQVDFCVSPNGEATGGARRDVRIVAGARNASGIEITTDADSLCGGS